MLTIGKCSQCLRTVPHDDVRMGAMCGETVPVTEKDRDGKWTTTKKRCMGVIVRHAVTAEAVT